MASFCLLRLGAPHCGHAALVETMLEVEPGACIVLVGSGDVVGRPDTPLRWEERRELLLALLHARNTDTRRISCAPLPELRTNGWDEQWCAYLLDAARGALAASHVRHQSPEPLTRYVFGDDYEASVFAPLVELAPSLELLRVARRYDKSARELRLAITHRDQRLLAKYRAALDVYPEETRARIAEVCAAGVDRPQAPSLPASP